MHRQISALILVLDERYSAGLFKTKASAVAIRKGSKYISINFATKYTVIPMIAVNNTLVIKIFLDS